MIEVDAFVIGIMHVIEQLIGRAFGKVIELAHRAATAIRITIVNQAVICGRTGVTVVYLNRTLAALVPCTFALCGADGAAP